jgi:2',3'-cyclic-nucleotide 2'-phosphodiesterase (5'-nucleotidase family)
MARWATLLEDRRTERPVMLIDTGDFCSVGKIRDKEIKDRYFFEALEMLRYDALGVAENEILSGRKNLEEKAKRLPLVSANILDKKSGEPVFDRYLIKRAGGGGFLFFRTGGIKVGFFSVAAPDLIYGADRLVRDYYEVIDPRIAALDAVTRLREKGCNVIVALSHQEWDRSVELARAVPGVDIIVASHSSLERARSEEINGVLVAAPGVSRTSFTELEVAWSPDDTRLELTDWGEELLKITDHPEFAELEKKFKAETKQTGEIQKIRQYETKKARHISR